jgi:16S rRNA (guanine527-N7)-methyltransferase
MLGWDMAEIASGLDPAQIGAVAARVAVALTESQARRLAAFGDLFLRWNEKINLGGVITPTGLVEQHFLDAFAAARFVGPMDSVVDVGAGGGLPAIPLALLRPQATFELYEPTTKKVAFLRTAIRDLALGVYVTVRQARLEDPLPLSILARFDVATSRATFPPGRWIDLGRRLVRPGGRVVVFGTDEEVPGRPDAAEIYRYAPNRRLLRF